MHYELEDVYREHRQGLFSLALSVTRCRTTAEDAIHNAFLRICRSKRLDQIANREGDLVAYVFRSVRNAAIDIQRAAQNRQKFSESIFNGFVQPLVSDQSPDESCLTEERDRQLRQAVDSLDEKDRSAIVLRAYSGLTFAQAGNVLGEPSKTVATRYHRALEKLKKRLASVEL